jgi:hypothetical protein
MSDVIPPSLAQTPSSGVPEGGVRRAAVPEIRDVLGLDVPRESLLGAAKRDHVPRALGRFSGLEVE